MSKTFEWRESPHGGLMMETETVSLYVNRDESGGYSYRVGANGCQRRYSTKSIPSLEDAKARCMNAAQSLLHSELEGFARLR